MSIGARPAAIIAAALISSSLRVSSNELVLDVAPGAQTLNIAIANAKPGATLRLASGVYRGPVVIDRSVNIIGDKASIVDGGAKGHVITVAAPDIRVQGLTVRNSGKELSTEDSGIFITAEGDNAHIIGNQLHHNLIGVYLKGPEDAVVRANTIVGRQDLRVNERGNGVHLWNTPGSVVENNDISFGRDGIFVTTSRDNSFRNNRFTDLRFAVHYMYTNNSEVSSNVSRGNDVGFALMYSTGLKVSSNVSNGDRDRGIFFNFANQSDIGNNSVRGGVEKCVFIYNSNHNRIHHNHFEACQIGVHFTAGSEQNALWANNFIANRTQVKYVGTRSLEWSRDGHGNYWSDHLAFDVNGDGVADRPYRPNNLVDQIIWRHPMAKILINSPVLQILQWAQSQFPALHPGGVTDSVPLMQPQQTLK
ncbi:MAG: nitrous oxide reductase family maturation protein NosD [Pseudomonadales bacterium]